MTTYIFSDYIIKTESKSEFFKGLNRSISFDDLRYKAAVNCIINNNAMQFTLIFNSKHYLIRINCGEVRIQQFINKQWHSLTPPFDPYFKKSKTKKQKS